MNDSDFNWVFGLPFPEAEQFFRDKLTISSDAWDDLRGKAHAKAFTSAGAYHADLLSEIRAITDKAIAGGLDIREFRKQFLPMVERYGWQLKGGNAAWRSDLIWRTNITTAYQAGRWQQFQDGGIEYLTYIHNDSVKHPRPNHVAMHGKIVPINDPFWTYNYPPNGWGCKCRAVASHKQEYRQAPDEKITLPANYEALADEGWNYNVGQAGEEHGYRSLTDKLETLSNDIAREWMNRLMKEPAFARFIDGKIKGDFPVAVMKPDNMEVLGSQRQVIWFPGSTINPDLTLEDYQLIPRIVDEGEFYQQGDDRFFTLKANGKVYRAALKKNQADNDNFFLSSFTTDEDPKGREL